jgi:hypothetical protein
MGDVGNGIHAFFCALNAHYARFFITTNTSFLIATYVKLHNVGNYEY